ncbi:hypothetical protein ACFV0L_25510 [Streptosporangium canum]|uniref:hypothetical protein n=1 Tax=Streptosporangium canum TaxID=324952 RepID=UPI0036B592FE
MIAGLRGCMPTRCRRAARWVAILVCLGLFLGWHESVPRLPGGVAAEIVASEVQPVDEVPSTPVTRHIQGKRDPRTQARGPVMPGAWGAVPPANRGPARRPAAGGSPATPQAEADRLTLLSISRI